MIEREINIHIEQGLNAAINEDWLRSIALDTLNAENIEQPVELGLVITDTETVWQLNKTYRDKDEPTDVLSFQMVHQPEQTTDSFFIAPPDGFHHLGEIVISYPQAVLQAKDQGHGINQELAFLIIHGILHLLGYDHENSEEGHLMQAREKEIMKNIKAPWS